VSGGLADIVPVYFLRLSQALTVVADGTALYPQYLAHIMQELQCLVHFQFGVDLFFLVDGVEDHQDFLAILVDAFAQDHGLIVEGKVFFVFLAELGHLLLTIVLGYALFQMFELEVEVEEPPVGRGVLRGLMKVEHLHG
jgi:hypothetical protein